MKFIAKVFLTNDCKFSCISPETRNSDMRKYMRRATSPKSLPVHPFNALIFPILRDYLQSVCSGNLFLIVPFPDICLLVLFFHETQQ